MIEERNNGEDFLPMNQEVKDHIFREDFLEVFMSANLERIHTLGQTILLDFDLTIGSSDRLELDIEYLSSKDLSLGEYEKSQYRVIFEDLVIREISDHRDQVRLRPQTALPGFLVSDETFLKTTGIEFFVSDAKSSAGLTRSQVFQSTAKSRKIAAKYTL